MFSQICYANLCEVYISQLMLLLSLHNAGDYNNDIYNPLCTFILVLFHWSVWLGICVCRCILCTDTYTYFTHPTCPLEANPLLTVYHCWSEQGDGEGRHVGKTKQVHVVSSSWARLARHCAMPLFHYTCLLHLAMPLSLQKVLLLVCWVNGNANI